MSKSVKGRTRVRNKAKKPQPVVGNVVARLLAKVARDEGLLPVVIVKHPKTFAQVMRQADLDPADLDATTVNDAQTIYDSLAGSKAKRVAYWLQFGNSEHPNHKTIAAVCEMMEPFGYRRAQDVIDALPGKTLKQFGLSRKQITPEILTMAAARDRESSAALTARIDRLQAMKAETRGPGPDEVVEPPEPPKDSRAIVAPEPVDDKAGRVKIFGQHVTAVMRWMGKDGWEFAHVRQVINQLGGSAYSDTTVRLQIRFGAKRQKPAAELTLAQELQLHKMVKEVK